MLRLNSCLIGAALLVPMLLAQDERPSETYSALAIGTGGTVGGKSMPFDFRINRYTTDEEVDNLATLLKEKGPDALLTAMQKLDAGRINPVGSTGNEIAVARKRAVGSDTVITMVTARIMPFIELYRGGGPRTILTVIFKLRSTKRARGPDKSWARLKFGSTRKRDITKSRATVISTSKLLRCALSEESARSAKVVLRKSFRLNC